MANTDNNCDRSLDGDLIETAEIYDEAYYKHYNTGIGPLAYEHSPHWLSFFASVADEIIRIFQPHSVLDAGCAIGLLVEALLDRGIRAQGVDVSHYAIENVRPDLRSLCRRASLTDPIEGKFDLVTCIEVLEHMDKADAKIAIANICEVTDTIFFSSTPSDFAEPTHVNICPPIVWIELFAENGFGPDLLADGTFLAPHAMIFRRGNSCDVAVLKTYALITRYRILVAERLAAIAAERSQAILAREAQSLAQTQYEQEAQLRSQAEASLAAERARTKASIAAESAAIDAQRRAEALAAVEAEARARADAQASLQAQLRAEAVAALADETQRYKKALTELESMLHDIQRSESWRATKPIRVAAIFLRDRLSRFKLRRGPRAVSPPR